MEKVGDTMGIPGSRQVDLNKSFKLAVRSLLTACSKQDFVKAFSKFSGAEQDRLYGLYIQVIASLYQNIENEFEALCQETQVGAILDTVEQLAEEQSLDPLYTDKTNVMDIAKDLSTAKKQEIQQLTDLLQRAEEHNRLMEARVNLLRKKAQESSGMADAVEKIKSRVLGYCSSNESAPLKQL
ncbi:PREDICTED: uncharacterized protein LOC104811080 [Tarenaya hassleriana]|uniref:uncharacterized protein LOC104811080 n=1 Tax=Tarenaya hassleriana TaxID=28532 RepID=UPI00053C10E4|nr:PREDICTED: uncharacterized protein LOC104811080 [Tarenaya hassleriana]